MTNLNADSDFPSEKNSTYRDYYNSRYQQTLKRPELPLLLVKGLSKRLNCIKPRGNIKKKKRDYAVEELENIHLIPELCVKQNFPSNLWLQLKLLPTILHRVIQLLRCEELRAQISHDLKLDETRNVPWEPLLFNVTSEWSQKEDRTDNISAEVNTEEITTINTRQLNKDFSSKMLERQYPWNDQEEPIDVERNLNVNLIDIKFYEIFIGKKLSNNDKNQRNEMQHQNLAIEYKKEFVMKSIDSLTKECDLKSPELRDVYQALCTLKANDIVNLERLETLGDSFLKVAVSLYVILKYPKYDEGKATTLKCQLISNKNLYYVGIKKNFGGILKNSDLEPKSQWKPPSFGIPDVLLQQYSEGKLNMQSLYSVNLNIDEQLTGIFCEETKNELENDLFMIVDEAQENQTSLYFLGKFLLFLNVWKVINIFIQLLKLTFDFKKF